MSSSFVPASQRSYNAHPYITISDHRPVSAEFLINVSVSALCITDSLITTS